ncbi:SLIT-ROBO Rho GTPase-activating protein 3-like isoform X2 [Osmerus eperlanus]|uniref:SLIT-ROBO Rho GTPase-activating protein 3-like isoform X2 n=1 Tax=Osmerus eperlanus TaxID=29151 RepID=UPI002E151389
MHHKASATCHPKLSSVVSPERVLRGDCNLVGITMTSYARPRKVVDYDTQIKEVRCQLVDQLKVLDLQLEQKTQQLQDLGEYWRRRGEIEGEYARSLDKLAERFTSKIKRKEPNGQSVAQCWLVLLSQTRQESREHSGLSESCSNLLTQPLTHCMEYTQRLAKRSKEICTQLQDGLLKVTAELQTAWRTYYQYHSEFLSAEGKLKEAEKLEEKQKQSAAKKVERLIEKRQGKVKEIHLKCTKARNDYLLNLAAANTSMNKYYHHDISSLIESADAGYHLSLSRVLRSYLSIRSQTQESLTGGLKQLHTAVSGLDQNQDRDCLLQTYNNAFCLSQCFQYQPHDGDQVCEVSAECGARCELETRFQQLQSRLAAVNQETEEAGKGVLGAHSILLEIICDDDLEPSAGGSCCSTSGGQQAYDSSSENLAAKPSVARRRANLQETEILYLAKVKDYLIGSSLVSKLQAKHDLLKVAIAKAEATNGHKPRENGKKSLRVRKNHPGTKFTQKLFTGDMLSFIEASGQQIPVVVLSCIRFINLNGLHHEGIFRVPGSQVEVNNLRDAFERGEDPLEDRVCDIDSVAGVLKLYFRGLEKPLFPQDSMSQLLECAQMDNESERAAKLKVVVSSYLPPVLVVMRYLFAFLHHVSQYSDENMMQPYNLAVCFGPSLVRGAQDDDVVTLQPQINALVKDIIVQHESIYPSQAELQGPVYEKCMTLEPDDCDPIIEDGDGESEMETGPLHPTTSAEMPQLKAERHRSNSRPAPTGGAVAPNVKFALQLPVGPHVRPSRSLSPGFFRKECQSKSSAEDIQVQVDKEVCLQMNSVFKELLNRQTPQDLPPITPSSQPLQKKGGGAGRKGKGLF